MAAVPYNSVWIPGEKTSVSTALEAGARNSPLRHRFLVYFGGDCSARGRDPEVSAGQFGEDVEGPAAVFGRGGQVGAHRGEVLGAGEGAQAPGHLLLDLHHADVALGRVVVERNLRVDGEAQVVIEAPGDAPGQGAVAAADRPGRGALGRGTDQSRGDDQPPVCGQRVRIGQRAGVGDRLEREQRV